MKDFYNFTEQLNIEFNGEGKNLTLSYLNSHVSSKLTQTSLNQLINCLEIKPFDLIISIEDCGRS